MVFVVVAITFLLAVVALGCQRPTREPKEVLLDQEFVLGMGKAAKVKGTGLIIELRTLVEDSRCPEGVDCLWSGNGKVNLSLGKPNQEPLSVDLNTHVEPRMAAYADHELRLVDLRPYPKTDVTIDREDYEAVLVVRAP